MSISQFDQDWLSSMTVEQLLSDLDMIAESEAIEHANDNEDFDDESL